MALTSVDRKEECADGRIKRGRGARGCAGWERGLIAPLVAGTSKGDGTMAMDYRVNYGNGQVSDTVKSRTVAKQRALECAYAWVEIYLAGSADCPGGWFAIQDMPTMDT